MLTMSTSCERCGEQVERVQLEPENVTLIVNARPDPEGYILVHHEYDGALVGRILTVGDTQVFHDETHYSSHSPACRELRRLDRERRGGRN